jgi:hypothetical protein
MRVPSLVLALALGAALAAVAGGCGSDDAEETGAAITQPPLTRTAATTPATTPTTGTTTAPPGTSTATTPATTPDTGGATATQPATTPSQSPGGAPAGCPAVAGGFIRDLQAQGTDCGVARSIATAWFDAVHAGAAPDAAIDAAGYACGATLAGQRASVTCRGGGGSVTFTASP